MGQNEEKSNSPIPEQIPELPPKLPDAWLRLLDAIRRHYGKSPEQ